MKRGLLLNLALSLGVTAALVAVLEGTARLIERRQPPRPPVADYIWNWDSLMPGGFYVAKSDAAGWPPWEEINGDGLRDRTRPHEKPDGVKRVAVLGDSVTLGAGIRADEAFPQRLEARLQREGRPIEVMNVALWGWSTRQQRIAWQRIARAYQPDVVILAVCLNDIPELHNNLERPAGWLAALHRRSAVVRLAVAAERREIASVERLFETPEPRAVLAAFERFFEELRALRREVEDAGVSFAVIVFPFRFQLAPDAPAPSVQRRVAAFCDGEGLRCVDLLPRLATIGPAAFVDYDHLSALGSEAVAQALSEESLLPQVDAAPALIRGALAAGGSAGQREALGWLATRSGPLGPGALRAFERLLETDEPALRAAGLWALADAGAAPARDAVEKILRADPSPRARGAAAAALGSMGDRRVVPALFTALADGSEAVRHEAARGLARVGCSGEDVPLLVRALDSPDDYVAAFAAWTLGNLGPQAASAVAALARSLDRERLDAVVSASLARIGPAAVDAVPTLVEALKSANADHRWRAARTLGRIGPRAAAAVPALEAALRDENGAVRLHAARALGRVGAPAQAAVSSLQRAAADGDEAVRREARQALERLQ